MGRKSARIGAFSYQNQYSSGWRSSGDFCEFLLRHVGEELEPNKASQSRPRPPVTFQSFPELPRTHKNLQEPPRAFQGVPNSLSRLPSLHPFFLPCFLPHSFPPFLPPFPPLLPSLSLPLHPSFCPSHPFPPSLLLTPPSSLCLLLLGHGCNAG